tara:strand:+ start:153 stop:548 length:396 start_codon:yes stop_codon:yes gene_type:complete
MKLTKLQNKKYDDFILSCICDNPKDLGYEYDFKKSPDKDKSKLDFFFYHFYNEYQWNIVRKGQLSALEEYLSGLPSTIDIPFYNYDILKLAKKFKSLPKNPTEKQEQKILDDYWHFVASKLIRLHDLKHQD